MLSGIIQGDYHIKPLKLGEISNSSAEPYPITGIIYKAYSRQNELYNYNLAHTQQFNFFLKQTL